MQASPYLARQESQTTRITRAASRPDTGSPVPGDTVINMGDLLPPPAADRVQPTDKKKQDTLFGPSIGIVNPGPDWAEQKIEQGEKAQLQDVLTRELVKSWVEKSKEVSEIVRACLGDNIIFHFLKASQPTTTLQALVNLKRPSLRLSPISVDDPNDLENSPPQQHGLEFQFDCDAPKCGISLHIIPAPTTKDTASSSGTLVDVFHKVVDGGFGRMLKLEAGATLELDKYDPTAPSRAVSSAPVVELPADAEPISAPASTSPDAPAETVPHQKKRFTLRIRKRTPDEDMGHVSVAGPALQVVDVETPAEGASAQEREAKEKSDGGVKVLIKLEALDANGESRGEWHSSKQN